MVMKENLTPIREKLSPILACRARTSASSTGRVTGVDQRPCSSKIGEESVMRSRRNTLGRAAIVENGKDLFQEFQRGQTGREH